MFFTDAFHLRLTQAPPMTLIDHDSLIRMNILPKDVRSGVLTLCDPLDSEDSEDEWSNENDDEEAPPTQERDPNTPDMGVRVANIERDIATMKGTLDLLQRTMTRVVNHLHVPPEPPDDEAGPSTILQPEFSLFEVD